jgi:hypothetical protein
MKILSPLRKRYYRSPFDRLRANGKKSIFKAMAKRLRIPPLSARLL